MSHLKPKIMINLLNSQSALLNWIYLHICFPFLRQIDDQQATAFINKLGVEPSVKLLKHKSLSIASKRMLIAFQKDQGFKPSKAKKIAVCLSGDIRSFTHCKASIERFFEGHEVVYFCHTWSDSDKHLCPTEQGNVFVVREDRPDLSELEKQSIESFGLKVYSKDKKVPFMSTNLFPMWYGVRQSFRMIQKNDFNLADFDLVARCRYDNLFLGQLEQCQGDWLDDQVVIDYNYNGYGGYGDQFAVGTPAAMEVYCTLFDWFETSFDLLKGKQRFFAEVVIQEYLQSKGLGVEQVNFGLRLLRSEFIGLPDDKVPLRSHLTSNNRNQQISDYIRDKFPDLFDRYS